MEKRWALTMKRSAEMYLIRVGRQAVEGGIYILCIYLYFHIQFFSGGLPLSISWLSRGTPTKISITVYDDNKNSKLNSIELYI